MARRIAEAIYIAVYDDIDGVACFAFWGGYGQGKIRWYKTRAEAERRVAEVTGDRDTRSNKPKGKIRIVKFVPEFDNKDL